MPHNGLQEKPVLIYDGQCRFCVYSKSWIARWDTHQRIRFIPFHEEAVQLWTMERTELDSMTRMQFVDRSGAVSLGVSAFRAVLRYLPMGKGIALLFHLPGFAWVAERIYRVIAKNRYRWFGRMPLGPP